MKLPDVDYLIVKFSNGDIREFNQYELAVIGKSCIVALSKHEKIKEEFILSIKNQLITECYTDPQNIDFTNETR